MTDVAQQDSSPGAIVATSIDRILTLAQTWLAWDGVPIMASDGVRVYTPNKAIRRHTDHLIDHLAEVQALISGTDSEPDKWHASFVTLASDLTAFTEADLNEAQQRLTRLARMYEITYTAAGPQEWDRPRDGHSTLREIAEHIGSPWYAEQVGDLAKR